MTPAWPPIAKGQSIPGAGVAALRIFLYSLVAPFVAVIIAYMILRAKAEQWPPAGAPAFPNILWISTLLILLVSLCAHWALKAVAKDDEGQLKGAMLLSSLLACAFMVTQTYAWSDLAQLHVSAFPELHTFRSLFYILTGYHALHVVVGLWLSLMVTWRSFRRRYWSYHHPGVRYHAMVWHFLDAIWLLLFLVLWWGNSSGS